MNLKTAVRPRKARKTRKKICLLYCTVTRLLRSTTACYSFKNFRAFRVFRGQNNFPRITSTFCLLLALSPITTFGDETELQALLGRIQQNGSAEFHYEEIRKLELASSPWQGQGFMLSGADGSLVKQQLKPTRVIMAIAEGRMYYWDPEQKQRHTAPLGQSGQTAELITVFIAILQGHAEELKSSYDFVPEQHGKRWTLRLTPKPGISNEDNASTIEISGDEDLHKQQVLIRQPEGESTEYRMVKTSEGQQLDSAIQSLLLEAMGD